MGVDSVQLKWVSWRRAVVVLLVVGVVAVAVTSSALWVGQSGAMHEVPLDGALRDVPRCLVGRNHAGGDASVSVGERFRKSVGRLLGDCGRYKSPATQVHLLMLSQLVGGSSGFRVPVPSVVLEPLLNEEAAIEFFGESVVSQHIGGWAFHSGSRAIVGESHSYQVVAALSDWAKGRATSVFVGGRAVPLSGFARHALNSAGALDSDLEWQMLVVMRWAKRGVAWRNKFNELVSLDSCMTKLLDRADEAESSPSMVRVSCAGTHILQALVSLSLMDEESPFLGGVIRERLAATLERWLSKVIQGQEEDGRWSVGWLVDREAPGGVEARLVADVLVTGHLLEAVLLLGEVGLDACVSKGVVWLGDVMAADSVRSLGSICPRTHALRVVLTR